jgi:hypothetical protein
MSEHNKKRPSQRAPEKPHRAKHKTAGPGESSKTRPDVPSTPSNKAATGKHVSRHGGAGGRGRGKG